MSFVKCNDPAVRAEFNAWNNARHRCTNPNHHDFPKYGARGITMHPEWLTSFTAFLQYIGPRSSPDYSLERINNDAGYVPGNVKWASKSEQQKNRRVVRQDTDRRYEKVTILGITKSANEWADFAGINRCTFRARINYGIEGADLLTQGRCKRRTHKDKPRFSLRRTDRPSPGTHITWNGRTQNMREWSRETGLSTDAIAWRRKQGWSPEQILTTPVRKKPV